MEKLFLEDKSERLVEKGNNYNFKKREDYSKRFEEILKEEDHMVKLQRAQGECLGTGSRRRTRLTAKSYGEP